jgi:glycosyltransferase involved in cell wall biosynthesis
MKKIAIVTPVKNEIENLPGLIESIENQSIPMFLWVIIENDSDDGSREFLEGMSKPSNVANFQLHHISFTSKEYDIGFKYSSVIQFGFTTIKSLDLYDDIDFIGILDSDSFPEKDYFAKLADALDQNPKMGLTSGVLHFRAGKKDSFLKNHVRGSGRIWSKACFEVAGDYYGFSPDSTTLSKAKILGWDPKVIRDAVFYSRPATNRVNMEFSGKSSYYRHVPFYYVLFVSFFYLLTGKFRNSSGYIRGYLKSYLSKAKRLEDPLLKKYYRMILLRKLGLWSYKPRKTKNT